MSFNWKSLVSSVAPVLGVAIGGPFGGLASKAIQEALGVEGETAIAQELQTNPEALIKLKQAGQDFDAKMKALDIDIMQIHADDRANARDLQKQNKAIIVPILAALTVACFFGVVFWVLTGKVSLESTLLGFVLGQVSSKAEQVYNFYFGSSSGSKDKTEKMAK